MTDRLTSWSTPLIMYHEGRGHRIVAAAGRLYTMVRRGDDEVVVAIDAASGGTVWEKARNLPLPADEMDLAFGPGPMSTPATVSGWPKVRSRTTRARQRSCRAAASAGVEVTIGISTLLGAPRSA